MFPVEFDKSKNMEKTKGNKLTKNLKKSYLEVSICQIWYRMIYLTYNIGYAIYKKLYLLNKIINRALYRVSILIAYWLPIIYYYMLPVGTIWRRLGRLLEQERMGIQHSRAHCKLKVVNGRSVSSASNAEQRGRWSGQRLLSIPPMKGHHRGIGRAI